MDRNTAHSTEFEVDAVFRQCGHDRRDLGQHVAQAMATLGDPSTLTAIQTQAPSLEPNLQHTVLFEPTRDHVMPLALPATRTAWQPN